MSQMAELAIVLGVMWLVTSVLLAIVVGCVMDADKRTARAEAEAARAWHYIRQSARPDAKVLHFPSSRGRR